MQDKNVFRLYYVPEIDPLIRSICTAENKFNYTDYLRYLYVISRVQYYRIHFKDYYNHVGVSINRNILASILSIPNHRATKIIKNLLEHDIIQKGRGFKRGSYSRTFKLNKEYEDLLLTFKLVYEEEATFIKNIIKRKRKSLRGIIF